MSQKLIFPKQRLFAPMLSTFGGGSVRGFNPGGGGGNNFSLNINGSDIDSGGVSGYTFFTKTTTGKTTMIVPSDTGITSLRIELRGAQGGQASTDPGYGGTIIVTADLTSSTFAGNTFYFVNGGQGGIQNYGSDIPGGYNGGGDGRQNTSYNNTGSGGGATDMRTTDPGGNPENYSSAGRILVGGGGGGSTANGGATGGSGGHPNGQNSGLYGGNRAGGGTQTSGGNLNGAFGLGGYNFNNTGWNGGGGGGWYGGGGFPTQHGGGAGGSSYYDSSEFTLVSAESTGTNTGNGYLKISLS